jgi:hypothetical protein
MPGTVLVREWDQKSHRVMVLAGGFAWNGQTYNSLSCPPLLGAVLCLARLLARRLDGSLSRPLSACEFGLGGGLKASRSPESRRTIKRLREGQEPSHGSGDGLVLTALSAALF